MTYFGELDMNGLNDADKYLIAAWGTPPLPLWERIWALVLLGLLAALIIYALRKL